MRKYMQALFVIAIISPEFFTITTSLKIDGETLVNYNETCDIIDGTKAYCPSEKSTTGRKLSVTTKPSYGKLACDANDTNAINYLKYLPDMFEIRFLSIENCTGFNELTAILKPFGIWNIYVLAISYNLETKLTADNFRGLISLNALHIDNRNFTTLEENCFQYVRSLEVLTLSRNNLVSVPANVFGGMKKLEELTMSHNKLKHLPEDLFKDLHKLEKLFLHNNELSALPNYIFRNTGILRKMQLNNNKLTAINEKLFASLTNLDYLDLSGNRLVSVHDNAFSDMTHLTRLLLNNNSIELEQPKNNLFLPSALRVLRLDVNAIRSFNESWFLECKSLTHINVSHNSIAIIQAYDLSVMLKPDLTIDLSYNLIRVMNFPQEIYNRSQLSNEQPQHKKPLKALYLSHNPWQCNCQSLAVHRFVKSNAKIIADVAEIRCNDSRFNKLLSDLETVDICPTDQTLTVTLITVACLSACVGILWALYYKYHHKVTIWLYAHAMCLRCITETELDHDKIFDAFISFSSKDEQFIAEHLQPQLEHGQRSFRLCIHSRDWLVGEVIADQIMRSIELSRRTIIVLSQNFITSSWSLMEFRAAHQAALNERRVRVIIIIYGEINDMENLDPLLESYLRMHTYLEWGDPWFWEKLRYAMPHPKRRGADVRQNFDDMELNRVHVGE